MPGSEYNLNYIIILSTYSPYIIVNAIKENGFISHDEETQLQVECRKLEDEQQKLLEDIENLKSTGKSKFICHL